MHSTDNDLATSESVRACAVLTSEAERLACYDRIAASLPSGENQRAAAARSGEENFGARGKVARAVDEKRGTTEPPPLARLEARVRKVARRPRGELIIELDNGQIWEQKEPKPEIFLEAGDAVAIAPGAFSSFWLSANSKRIRVGRVR